MHMKQRVSHPKHLEIIHELPECIWSWSWECEWVSELDSDSDKFSFICYLLYKF